jgi:F-type H+-transporting ATPase subunit delta
VSVQAQPKDYAKAVYDLALEAWTGQLGHVQRALKQDASLRVAMADPSTELSDKLYRLQQATSCELSENVQKLLGTLLQAGQIEQLDAILVELDHLIQQRPKRQIARITSAVPLTEAEQEALRKRLIARYGADLEFQFDLDASLIGGIYLRVGDQVIDGSVAGKLAAMRDELAA